MSIFLDFTIMIKFTSMIGFAELLCYVTASKKCQLQTILNMAFTLDMPFGFFGEVFPVTNTLLGP